MRDALKDAFAAGWNIGKSNGGGPDRAFEQWYQRALETLDRSPVPSDDDGWITWDGSADMPPDVDPDQSVSVRFRSGVTATLRARQWYWGWDGMDNGCIEAYRVMK